MTSSFVLYRTDSVYIITVSVFSENGLRGTESARASVTPGEGLYKRVVCLNYKKGMKPGTIAPHQPY